MEPRIPLPGFSDPVSSLSHLLAAGVMLFVGTRLIYRGKGDTGGMVALGVFVFTALFLLSMSGVYHLLSPEGAARPVLQRLDHAAIFALIAGSFTPMLYLLSEGAVRWFSLLAIWALAATGITLKVIFFEDVPEWLGLTLYLGMGWIGVIAAIQLARKFGGSFIRPLVCSGLAYTLGAVSEYLRWPVVISGVLGPHELFHLAVLAGIAFHCRFLFGILSERQAGGAESGTTASPRAEAAAKPPGERHAGARECAAVEDPQAFDR